jgi:hypothetical protein
MREICEQVRDHLQAASALSKPPKCPEPYNPWILDLPKDEARLQYESDYRYALDKWNEYQKSIDPNFKKLKMPKDPP